MTGEHTIRLLLKSANWARMGGHDHRTIRDQFNDCAAVLVREANGEDVKSLVDEAIAELDEAIEASY